MRQAAQGVIARRGIKELEVSIAEQTARLRALRHGEQSRVDPLIEELILSLRETVATCTLDPAEAVPLSVPSRGISLECDIRPDLITNKPNPSGVIPGEIGPITLLTHRHTFEVPLPKGLSAQDLRANGGLYGTLKHHVDWSLEQVPGASFGVNVHTSVNRKLEDWGLFDGNGAQLSFRHERYVRTPEEAALADFFTSLTSREQAIDKAIQDLLNSVPDSNEELTDALQWLPCQPFAKKIPKFSDHRISGHYRMGETDIPSIIDSRIPSHHARPFEEYERSMKYLRDTLPNQQLAELKALIAPHIKEAVKLHKETQKRQAELTRLVDQVSYSDFDFAQRRLAHHKREAIVPDGYHIEWIHIDEPLPCMSREAEVSYNSGSEKCILSTLSFAPRSPGVRLHAEFIVPQDDPLQIRIHATSDHDPCLCSIKVDPPLPHRVFPDRILDMSSLVRDFRAWARAT